MTFPSKLENLLDKLCRYSATGLPSSIQEKLSNQLTDEEFNQLLIEFKRRSSGCNLDVDVSDFAQFPLATSKYKGRSFTVDKVSL